MALWIPMKALFVTVKVRSEVHVQTRKTLKMMMRVDLFKICDDLMLTGLKISCSQIFIGWDGDVGGYWPLTL